VNASVDLRWPSAFIESAGWGQRPSPSELLPAVSKEDASGLRASLRASSSGVLLGTEWLEHLSASKEARMNNLLRNYT